MSAQRRLWSGQAMSGRAGSWQLISVMKLVKTKWSKQTFFCSYDHIWKIIRFPYMHCFFPSIHQQEAHLWGLWCFASLRSLTKIHILYINIYFRIIDGNRRKSNLKIIEKWKIFFRSHPVYAEPSKIESVHMHLTCFTLIEIWFK